MDNNFNDFITAARAKKIPDKVIYDFISQSLVDKWRSQNQTYDQTDNRIGNPNATLLPSMGDSQIDLIPTPQQPQFSLLGAKGPITQQFGNYNPALYRGINASMRNTGVDIGVPEGTDVNLPPGQWEVVEAGGGWNRGYGNSILVKNVKTGEKLRFSHLSQMAGLKPGQRILGGQRFAKTGRTGNVTGAHLDLEYYDQLNRLRNVLDTSYGGGL